LNYKFRDKKLIINLDNDNYAVADGKFKVTARRSFGFNSTKGQLSYFNGASPAVALNAASAGNLSIDIKNWDGGKMEWHQQAAKPVTYVLHQLNPNTGYKLEVNGKQAEVLKSDVNGELKIAYKSAAANEDMMLSKVN
jgi:hypothetical protein